MLIFSCPNAPRTPPCRSASFVGTSKNFRIGLLCAPEFLLVTLARYASVARGKNRTRVPCKAMQRASFPVFTGSDHAVQWTPCSLVAGVLHLGSTPQQGHYRTFMAHPRAEPCANMQELTAFSTEPSRSSASGRGYSALRGDRLHLVVYRRW